MMKHKTQFYLTVAGTIILFDVVASFASKSVRFDYTGLGWVSWCLYIASGYLGCRFYGFLGGLMGGLVAGVADSTIGWLLSSAIGPYVPFEQPHYTYPFILMVVTIVSVKATIFGLMGALLCLVLRRHNRSADA